MLQVLSTLANTLRQGPSLWGGLSTAQRNVFDAQRALNVLRNQTQQSREEATAAAVHLSNLTERSENLLRSAKYAPRSTSGMRGGISPADAAGAYEERKARIERELVDAKSDYNKKFKTFRENQGLQEEGEKALANAATEAAKSLSALKKAGGMVVTGVITAATGLELLSRRQVEVARDLSQFDLGLAKDTATLDRDRILRQAELARRTSESNRAMIESRNRMEEEMLPAQIQLQKGLNNLSRVWNKIESVGLDLIGTALTPNSTADALKNSLLGPIGWAIPNTKPPETQEEVEEAKQKNREEAQRTFGILKNIASGDLLKARGEEMPENKDRQPQQPPNRERNRDRRRRPPLASMDQDPKAPAIA